ncbi:hypothetical protein [Tsuneonella sp. SYSU-LHT278]|uniref:hypothetical protein n=1 Tax=Tsuneonella sediminis TaxID=3416089 RepID=UPI003F795CA8
MIDTLIGFFERHKRTISVAGIVWFALGCAITARFIELPDWRFWSDEFALYSGAAYNAIWWGFLRPAVQRRRANLLSEPVIHG